MAVSHFIYLFDYSTIDNMHVRQHTVKDGGGLNSGPETYSCSGQSLDPPAAMLLMPPPLLLLLLLLLLHPHTATASLCSDCFNVSARANATATARLSNANVKSCVC